MAPFPNPQPLCLPPSSQEKQAASARPTMQPSLPPHLPLPLVSRHIIVFPQHTPVHIGTHTTTQIYCNISFPSSAAAPAVALSTGNSRKRNAPTAASASAATSAPAAATAAGELTHCFSLTHTFTHRHTHLHIDTHNNTNSLQHFPFLSCCPCRQAAGKSRRQAQSQRCSRHCRW